MSDLWSKPRSLRDVADDIAGQIPDDPDSGAVDPSMAQPVANQAPSQKPRPATNPPNVNGFFDQQRDRIGALAKEMKVPENYMLGLAAGESSWGNPPQGKNNLFGLSDPSGKPLDFPSFDASVDAFRKSPWFNRLQGKNAPDEFINELVDDRNGQGRYNPNPRPYRKFIGDMISTINRRLPIWEGSE